MREGDNECIVCGAKLPSKPFFISSNAAHQRFRCRKCRSTLSLRIDRNGFLVWTLDHSTGKGVIFWLVEAACLLCAAGALLLGTRTGFLAAGGALLIALLVWILTTERSSR